MPGRSLVRSVRARARAYTSDDHGSTAYASSTPSRSSPSPYVFLPSFLSVVVLLLSRCQLQCSLSRISVFVSCCLARSAPNSKDRVPFSKDPMQSVLAAHLARHRCKEKQKKGNDRRHLHIPLESPSLRFCRAFFLCSSYWLFPHEILKAIIHSAKTVEKERSLLFLFFFSPIINWFSDFSLSNYF